MYGGTANIYGGTFGKDSSGSGAFVMGTSTNQAKANIYGGTFDVNGQAAFSVFEYVDVTFTPRGGEKGAGGDITVTGAEAGMTVEYRGNAGSSVTINGGTFSSKDTDYGNGVWCGEGRVKLIITNGTFTGTGTTDSRSSGLMLDAALTENAVSISGGNFSGFNGVLYNYASSERNGLTISGGEFKGTRSGLYFNAVPTNYNVQISGGTFTTSSENNNAISGVDITYGSILSDSPAARAEVTYGNNSNSTYASNANTYITYVIEEGAWYDRIYYYAHTVNVFHD